MMIKPMFRRLRLVCLTLVSLMLVACVDPIPPERFAYVGDWRADNMKLVINADGIVNYYRKQGPRETTINAPLKQFEEGGFVVGVLGFTTKFMVDVPPHQEGDDWWMQVDGVMLQRAKDING
ncbi:hypothetical protein ACFSJ3_16535 [Corallincola platygyrae]|uniref:Lipoprotein n=1 Tax=Corallincola platygyrae TaxID=1193278 RepID=A0ABW4XRY2_9GAMM